MGGHLNGPVGEYTDPTVYVDKLPQPFRLVDKLLAEIVENALNVAGEAERAREEVLMNKSDTALAAFLANGLFPGTLPSPSAALRFPPAFSLLASFSLSARSPEVALGPTKGSSPAAAGARS
mmetsp:Transcript_29557/g.94820  ORF Transcript_29557/g.94820 Transcript_29557/m.94820 type:complete len:122 (+) Transcript_29557:3072-3437(+)